jgi:hypothetical protein
MLMSPFAGLHGHANDEIVLFFLIFSKTEMIVVPIPAMIEVAIGVDMIPWTT